RAEAARGIERLVQRAVDLDLFQSLERGHFHGTAVDDRLAGIAVLVDESLGRPGERVFEDVVRMLWQGSHAQLHRAQLLEMLDELRRGDADEARRETALRDERPRRASCDRADGTCYLDVLGQIEVVDAGSAGGLRHRDVAVERQTGNDGIDRMAGQMLLERASLLGVQRVCAEAGSPVRTHDGFRNGAVDVRELNLIAAGAGQEPGDEGADLAGAEDEYAMHSAPPA